MRTIDRLIRAISLAAALGAAVAGAPAAEVSLNGFAEAGYGIRTASDPWFEGGPGGRAQDYTLEESRAQLRLNAYGGAGEVFVRLDFLQDQLATRDTDLELREAFFRFSTLRNHLDVKAGRQIMTWGTGDLIFINDLFPKDYVSFFVGRDDQYLKAPTDALRLGIFGLPADIEIAFTPEFTPDRLPTGQRLSFYSPLPPGAAGVEPPTNEFENGELAIKLQRTIGNFAAALYGYRGFYKSPLGIAVAADSSGMMMPTAIVYPDLTVYGASLRGSGDSVPLLGRLVGGIVWLEGGYYDSRQDRDGNDPLVPNSTLRYLAGWERQLFTEFTAGVQYYGEWMEDYDAYQTSLAAATEAFGLPLPKADEYRSLFTVRLEKYLKYQTIRLSLFTFVSPSDEDVYVRPLVSYKVSDDVEVTTGANVFAGDDPTTQFAQFDKNDNIFVRMRYSF